MEAELQKIFPLNVAVKNSAEYSTRFRAKR